MDSIRDKYISYKDNIDNVLEDIEKMIPDSNTFEGNCFYYNKSFERKDELITKQMNIFWLGTLSKCNICEIGFNAGHSAYLLLLNNKNSNIHFTIFDINQHEYTLTCLEYMKHKFDTVNFEFIEGNSIVEFPNWLENTGKYNHFDIIHVDGCHLYEYVVEDLKNSVNALKVGGIIIIDDVQKKHINDLVDLYLETKHFKEITSMFKTDLYPHRIIMKMI